MAFNAGQKELNNSCGMIGDKRQRLAGGGPWARPARLPFTQEGSVCPEQIGINTAGAARGGEPFSSFAHFPFTEKSHRDFLWELSYAGVLGRQLQRNSK